jgi:hypothetical protein
MSVCTVSITASLVLLRCYGNECSVYPPAFAQFVVPALFQELLTSFCSISCPCCPAGTCHIALPGAAAACRSLGIDYAPALVGFDVQRGRNLPKILGVVVCEVRIPLLLHAPALQLCLLCSRVVPGAFATSTTCP